MNFFISLVKSLPPQLAVAILAAVPIIELRGSVPLALQVYHLSPFWAVFWSVVGAMVPVLFILFVFEWIYRYLDPRSKILHKIFEFIFSRTRHKFEGKYNKLGAVALVILSAVPLPFFGSWTAALAAWLFGIKPRIALPYILYGVTIMGILVLLITYGAVQLYFGR